MASPEGPDVTAVSHSLFRYGPCPRLNTVSGDEAAAAAADITHNDDNDDAMSVLSTESAPLPSLPLLHVASMPGDHEERASSPVTTDVPLDRAKLVAQASKAESAQYDVEITKYMLQQSQLWFPAEAGVFVGNLPAKSYSDADLTRLLLYYFAKIAPCFGKVERTVSNANGRMTEKPWAIIQFTVRRHWPQTEFHVKSKD